MGSTYSFRDGQGTINLPPGNLALLMGGASLGVGQVTFSKADNVSEQNTSADGNVMTSAIAAPNGTVSVEVQQTSDIHLALLAWYNYLDSQFRLGDVSNWTAASIYWFNAVDGTSHTALGVSPQKNPDKVYAKQGSMVTWVLMAQDLISE